MITKRQLSILNAIVEDYVDFGQPIGSKTLIHRHHLDVSPATIRNEMKQLEEMHFIEKTHTHLLEGCHLNQGLDIMSIAF